MGTFSYAGLDVEFEDRLLAHLQVVIGAKIRRGESFHFSWEGQSPSAPARTIVWITPHVPIVYGFGVPLSGMNPRWLEDLTASANTPAGLQLVEEPAEVEQYPIAV